MMRAFGAAIAPEGPDLVGGCKIVDYGHQVAFALHAKELGAIRRVTVESVERVVADTDAETAAAMMVENLKKDIERYREEAAA
jgi:hypothetical protein